VPEALIQGELAVNGFDARGGAVAYTASAATSLSELHVDARRATDVGHAFASARELVAPERFTATSADGTQVEAWIVRPAGFRPDARYPVLLSIHGGPFSQYGSAFMDEFQVWAGAGYAVVYANPRGSSGYSEAWARAIRGPLRDGPGWGTLDHDDVIAAFDEALRRFPFCDGDRAGVLGGSYGGYMTTWIVAHTDRFRAACSERALNSFVSQWGSSDFGWAFAGYTGGFVFEDIAAHLDRSPLTHAQRITTPLLILHSEDDLRCPVEQAEQLFTTLRVLRREVEMVRFPAESHELSRSGSPVHRVQRFEVILDWFGRYLSAGA
jgi:dipeptidyl aminopeptidase/acylaminoacyl peptidase